MPSVASLDAFHRAITEFVVLDLDLVIEPRALVAARRSLDCSGLLLVGEVHGVRENPLLIRALMKAFGLTSLALEWPEDLTPMIQAFLASQTLADHLWLWGGDGRITAGHLAVLADRAAAAPLDLTLFDGIIGADWGWPQRDEAMARRILATSPPSGRTLVVAGNAHTPIRPAELGVPMGARVAEQRPGIRDVPDQLRRREFLQWRTAPIRPPHRPAGTDPAAPAPRRARTGPSRSHRGGRATATAP